MWFLQTGPFFLPLSRHRWKLSLADNPSPSPASSSHHFIAAIFFPGLSQLTTTEPTEKSSLSLSPPLEYTLLACALGKKGSYFRSPLLVHVQGGAQDVKQDGK